MRLLNSNFLFFFTNSMLKTAQCLQGNFIDTVNLKIRSHNGKFRNSDILKLVDEVEYTVADFRQEKKLKDVIHPNQVFDKIFVINLKRDTGNRQVINEILGKYNIKFEFFDAVDGDEIELTNKELELINHEEMNRYELAYLRTWYKLIQHVIEINVSNFLCFDDDIRLCSDFLSRFTCFIKSIDKWDILYLGASQHSWVDIDTSHGYYYNASSQESNWTQGSFAVAVTNNLYDRLRSKIALAHQPFDVGALAPLTSSESMVAYPNLVIADVSKSHIRGERDVKKHAQLMRWNLDNYAFAKYLKLKACTVVYVVDNWTQYKPSQSYFNHQYFYVYEPDNKPEKSTRFDIVVPKKLGYYRAVVYAIREIVETIGMYDFFSFETSIAISHVERVEKQIKEMVMNCTPFSYCKVSGTNFSKYISSQLDFTNKLTYDSNWNHLGIYTNMMDMQSLMFRTNAVSKSGIMEAKYSFIAPYEMLERYFFLEERLDPKDVFDISFNDLEKYCSVMNCTLMINNVNEREFNIFLKECLSNRYIQEWRKNYRSGTLNLNIKKKVLRLKNS